MSDISVLFYSRGGNTRKVADAIAGELGVKAADVKSSPSIGSRITFLGSGIYAGKLGDDMAKFVESGNFTGCKMAIFYTCMNPHGNQKAMDAMTSTLKQKGATVLGIYYCKGKTFVLFNRGHPNKEDLDNAKKFAREMLKLI